MTGYWGIWTWKWAHLFKSSFWYAFSPRFYSSCHILYLIIWCHTIGSNVILCIECQPLIRLSSGNLFFSSVMQNQNIWWEWKLGVSFFWCWIKREAIFKHKYSWMEKESTISIEWNPRRSGPWAALSGFQDLNGSGLFFPQLTENDIYSSLQVVPSGLFLSLNYFTWYKPRL